MELSSNEISSLIFWEYEDGVNYDDIKNLSANELFKKLDIGIDIPLACFVEYDSKLYRFTIPNSNIVSGYALFQKEIYKNYKNKKLNDIFFTVIVNNVIVLTGLNRAIPFSATGNYRTEKRLPCIIINYHEVGDKVDSISFQIIDSDYLFDPINSKDIDIFLRPYDFKLLEDYFS